MLTSDPDRYYSPLEAANALVSLIKRYQHRTVLDSNCGSGSLLDAMSRSFPEIRCAGIDVDKEAINRLRKIRPNWALVPGDALSQKTWSKLKKLSLDDVDVAVLNPPFSMGTAKGLRVTAWGSDIRCSLAMAHVLATLEYTAPQHLAAILPESWAHSSMDSLARNLIECRYRIKIDRSFSASTFHGARVHSILVVLKKRATPRNQIIKPLGLPPVELDFELIRGRLACFKVEESTQGIPFVHSTDLGSIEKVAKLRKVLPYNGNTVRGSVIFLPRVGLPKIENLKAVFLNKDVQLSDCVLALKFDSLVRAKAIASIIEQNWLSLIDLYKGTGARYVTVDRLRDWLIEI